MFPFPFPALPFRTSPLFRDDWQEEKGLDPNTKWLSPGELSPGEFHTHPWSEHNLPHPGTRVPSPWPWHCLCSENVQTLLVDCVFIGHSPWPHAILFGILTRFPTLSYYYYRSTLSLLLGV